MFGHYTDLSQNKKIKNNWNIVNIIKKKEGMTPPPHLLKN